jgi:formylglycine-generating enzyme required for sulfatase activity
MATFGRFETVHEIHRTGYTTVYSGRSPESTEDKFAVKVFQPPALLLDGVQAKTEIGLFLKSTVLQQKVAAGGAQHWAPILQHGSSHREAFYVTEKYEYSLQHLIDVRLKLNSKVLVTIVESVAKGLIELQELCGRPHGNLKAPNVLIGGIGDISQKKIVLCDPLPDVHIDTDLHRDNDLRAIAGLIYQLVVHQQPPRVDGWQAPDSKEWISLGKQATTWRNLCNRLLNAHVKPGTITIEILLEELAQLKKIKPVLSYPRLIAAGFALVACAVTLFIFFRPAPAEPEKWKRLCDEYFAWMGDLYQELGGRKIENNDTANKWRKNEELGKQVKNIEKAGYPFKWYKPEEDRENIVNNPKSKDVTDEALRAIEDIKNFFDSDSNSPWPLLLEMREDANSFEEHGWKKPAAYLASLVSSVRPEPNQPIAENVNKILDLTDANTLEKIESSQKQITTDQKTIKSLNDPILSKFNDEFVNRTVDSIADQDDGDDLSRLQNRLEEIKVLGRKLAEFVSDPNWPREFRVDLLTVDQSPLYNKSTLTTEDFEHWLREVMRYKKLDPDPREDIDEAMEKLRKNIKLAKDFQPEKANMLDEQLKQEIKNIEEIRKKPGITKYQNEIKKMTFDCLDTLRNLNIQALALIVDPIEWWEEIEKTSKITNSNTINAEWRRRRDLELGKYKKSDFDRKKNIETFISLKEKIEQTSGRLENLNKTLHPNITVTLTQTDWNTQLSDLYENKREELLSRIIGEMARLADILDPNSSEFKDEWRKELSDLNDWQNKSGQLITAFNEIEDRLDACYLLDDKILGSLWKTWKGDNILEEPRIKSALEELTKRLTDLEKIGGSVDKDWLLDISLASNSQTEAVYAAWVRLGSVSAPPWPNDFEDVNNDRAIRATLKTKFETIKLIDEIHRDYLLTVLAGTGLEREMTFIGENRSGDEALAKFGEFATEEKRRAALPELVKLESLAGDLADFVSSEDWQKDKIEKNLLREKSPLYTKATLTKTDFEDWPQEAKLYRKLDNDPRDDPNYTWNAKIDKIGQDINKELARRPTGEYLGKLQSLKSQFDDVVPEIKDMRGLPAIKRHKNDIDKCRDYWGKLIEIEKQLKPDFCNRIDLSNNEQVIFSPDISLNALFEPVIKKDTDKFEPLTINSWDRFRTSNTLGTEFFYETEGDGNQNAGWPKFIRSTSERDPSVIFRFIPAGPGNLQPFYIAVHEITNAQYKLFLEKITAKAIRSVREWKFSDQKNNDLELVSARRREDPSRACKIEWDGTSFIVTQGYENFPVTWVTYDGAKEYAKWFGGQLPTALQHQYACSAGTNTTYPWGNDPCRIPGYAHVAGAYLKEAADEYNNSLTNPDDPNTLIAEKRPAPVGAIKHQADFIPLKTPIDLNKFPLVHGEKVYGSAWPITHADKPNAWDLYDMIGNVWEWCQDDTRSVICGGSCLAARDDIPLEDWSNYSAEFNKTECDVGFRVIVLTPAK